MRQLADSALKVGRRARHKAAEAQSGREGQPRESPPPNRPCADGLSEALSARG